MCCTHRLFTSLLCCGSAEAAVVLRLSVASNCIGAADAESLLYVYVLLGREMGMSARG